MSRGGKRWGAGRPAKRRKAEDCWHIASGDWARSGLLQVPCAGAWAWTDVQTGKRLGSIGYAGDGDALTLTYAYNNEPRCQRVPILTTPCTFGGSRYWFGCPECGRRVGVLYLRPRGFACRHCHDISYASQSDDAMDRAWRRQYKIERRLGKTWRRPKGMHHATHQRLMAKIFECEELREEALATMAARLGIRF